MIEAIGAWGDAQDAALAEVRDLGDRYHPADLATGAPLSRDAVESRQLEGYDATWESAARAGLGHRSTRVIESIAKAQRVLPSLVGWVRAWHRRVSGNVAVARGVPRSGRSTRPRQGPAGARRGRRPPPQSGDRGCREPMGLVGSADPRGC